MKFKVPIISKALCLLYEYKTKTLEADHYALLEEGCWIVSYALTYVTTKLLDLFERKW